VSPFIIILFWTCRRNSKIKLTAHIDNCEVESRKTSKSQKSGKGLNLEAILQKLFYISYLINDELEKE
jgi:hypothetical protein